jgi:hypothetical protein
LLSVGGGDDFLRIRSVDRLAPATRGPDSLDTAFVVVVVVVVVDFDIAGATSICAAACTDDTVALGGGTTGGTTVTTLAGSDVTMTGLGYCTQTHKRK